MPVRLYNAVPHSRVVIAGLRFEKPLHRSALQALGGIPSKNPQRAPTERDPLPRGADVVQKIGIKPPCSTQGSLRGREGDAGDAGAGSGGGVDGGDGCDGAGERSRRFKTCIARHSLTT